MFENIRLCNKSKNGWKKRKLNKKAFIYFLLFLFYLILYVNFSVGLHPERFSVEVSEWRHQRNAQLRHTDKEEHTLLKASFFIRLLCLSPPEVYLSFSAKKKDGSFFPPSLLWEDEG